MRVAVVTGVSTGLGRATAEKFLERGYTVIGSVRNSAVVDDLKQKYPTQFLIWNCDFLKMSEIDSIIPFLKQNQISQVDVLINNAGVALSGPFQLQKFSEIENMFQVNVLSLMKMTQVMIPYLIPTQGRIINISSVSGKGGTPFLAGYCASKHAVEGFSESLRREMNIYGIKVSIVGPGSVKTPIWSKGLTEAHADYHQSVYKNSFNKFLDFARSEEVNGLETQVVVKDILHAAESKRPKIRYAPVPRKFRNWYWPMLLPQFIVDDLMCKALGLSIKKN